MRSLYISYDGAMDPLGQSQIAPYLKNLAKNGIDFNLLTFEKPQYLKDENKVKRLKQELVSQKIKWSYLKYHKSPTVLCTAYDLFRGLLAGVGIVRANRIRIVHARGYPPALIALILKKLLKLKFIFDIRGLWADEKADAGTWSRQGFLYRLTKYLEKKFFLNADAAVVLSKKAKKIIEALPYYKYNPVKIEVIPTCVDLERFQTFTMSDKCPPELKDKFLIIYIGSLGTWYMLNEMVIFFRVAKRINSDALFLVLTPSNDLVKGMLQKEGVADRDFYLDFVSYDEVPYWISLARAAIFFIMPSYSKKTSCPTKFAESLACGLPVITNSGIGDIEEIIRRERVGIIVEDFNESSYTKAVGELSALLQEGPELRQRCRATAIKYFSLKNGSDRYLKVYRGIFNNA